MNSKKNEKTEDRGRQNKQHSCTTPGPVLIIECMIQSHQKIATWRHLAWNGDVAGAPHQNGDVAGPPLQKLVQPCRVL